MQAAVGVALVHVASSPWYVPVRPLPIGPGPSICPPASLATCTPVARKRVVSDSTTYQLNSGNVSSKFALPLASENNELLNLPLRNRTRLGTCPIGGSPASRMPLPFTSR